MMQTHSEVEVASRFGSLVVKERVELALRIAQIVDACEQAERRGRAQIQHVRHIQFQVKRAVAGRAVNIVRVIKLVAAPLCEQGQREIVGLGSPVEAALELVPGGFGQARVEDQILRLKPGITEAGFPRASVQRVRQQKLTQRLKALRLRATDIEVAVNLQLRR